MQRQLVPHQLAELTSFTNEMFNLRWQTYNNNWGWIEPTNYCQLKCLGCYRGLDKNPQRFHEDLIKQKKEIDTLIKLRGIKTITISGGEPLLYPKLNGLISYAKSKNLTVRILSNGVALTEKRLKELEKLGVDEILIHVSEYQSLPNYNKEKFVEMFKDSKIIFGFITTVSEVSIKEIPSLLEYCKAHKDIARMILSIKWGLPYSWYNRLRRMVEKVFPNKMQWCIRKVKSKRISWLYYNNFVFNRNFLKQLKLLWKLQIPPGQVIILVSFPDKLKDGWDFCDGCPDAMVYKGRLVPSCLLERIKEGEEIWLE